MGALEKIGVYAAIGLGTAAVSLAGVAVHKLIRLSKKFNKSVSELDELTVKDIQKVVVQEAVDKAAKNAVADYVRDVNSVIMADARLQLKKEAASAVEDARKDIHDRVSDVTAVEVSRIDMAEFRKEVRDKAEEKVLSKFDDNMQDIMDRFSGNLSSMYKTYSSFAEMMGKLNKNDEKKVNFTIG